MMNCREVEDALSAYIDGELAPAEVLGVTNHLSVCSNCRQELVELQELINSIRTLPELDPPADFHARLCARLESLESKRPWYKQIKSRQWFPMGAAAAAILLLLVSLNVITPFTSMPKSTSEIQSEAANNSAVDSNKKSEEAPGIVAYDVAEPTADEGQEQVKIQALDTEMGLEQEKDTGDSNKVQAATENANSSMEANTMAKAKVAQQASANPEQTNAADPVHTSESKSLNDRNGSQIDRQESEKQNAIQGIAQAEPIANDFSALTWNISLQVKDLDQVKKELESLAYSMGGTLSVSNNDYVELSLPHTRVGETLEGLKKHGYPITIEASGKSVGERLQSLNKKQEELSQRISDLEKEVKMTLDRNKVLLLEQELKSLYQDLKSTQISLKAAANGNAFLNIHLQN